jgi:hypothetical protein
LLILVCHWLQIASLIISRSGLLAIAFHHGIIVVEGLGLISALVSIVVVHESLRVVRISPVLKVELLLLLILQLLILLVVAVC